MEKLPEKSKKIKFALKKLKKDLKKLYEQKMQMLILYGSYALGKAHEESDVDILLVLKNMKSPYQEISATSDITIHYLLEYDLNISIVPTTYERFTKINLSFYKNIQKEGIVL